jgi:hypothetical protein
MNPLLEPEQTETNPLLAAIKWKEFKAGLNALLQDPKRAAELGLVKGAVSGATLAGDVYAGREAMPLPTQMSQEQGLRVADMAGLAMSGGVAGTGQGGVALGAGPIKGYHGSPRTDLNRVLANPEARQFDNATSQLGGFFAPERSGAERYAGKGGQIYKGDVPLANPYEMSWGEFARFQAPNKGPSGESLPGEMWVARAEELKAEAAAFRRQLEEAGHDGVLVRGPKGDIKEIASFKDVDVTLGAGANPAAGGGVLNLGLMSDQIGPAADPNYHNDFVARVRAEAKNYKPPKEPVKQRSVPAILGIRG